jgi:hypothetical protein
MNQPASFIREREGYYWVLAEYESSSEPGKMYEVRTSQRDGKTYCTCKGWVCALNRIRKTGGSGEALCRHLLDFKATRPEEPLVVMDFNDFAVARRHLVIVRPHMALPDDIQTRRA